VKYVTLMSK